MNNFQNALDSFEKAMSIDFSSINEIEKDTIKSGQVQKFEILNKMKNILSKINVT